LLSFGRGVVVIFGFIDPDCHLVRGAGQEKRKLRGDVPTVADHADPFAFRLPIESSALLEILLTPNPLGVAKASFG
jgi:hypothetical protein